MELVQKKRNVAILIYNDVEILDFTGPYEVFITGSNYGQDFHVYTVAEHNHPITALGNLSVNPAYTIHDCPKPDIILIPGGRGVRQEMNNKILTDWIQRCADEAELVLSVCTGALLLAKAVELEGLKLTTYRLAIEELRQVVPESTQIVDNVKYVDNGKIVMSAGVSAGIDMSLYVVGRLHGEERAQRTAELMEYNWSPKEHS